MACGRLRLEMILSAYYYKGVYMRVFLAVCYLRCAQTRTGNINCYLTYLTERKSSQLLTQSFNPRMNFGEMTLGGVVDTCK